MLLPPRSCGVPATEREARQKELVRPCRVALRRPRTCAALPRLLTPNVWATSNHRITAFDGERVSFLWRDIAHGGKQKVSDFRRSQLPRRFFLHVSAQRASCASAAMVFVSNCFCKRATALFTLLAEQGVPRTAASSATLIRACGTVPAAEKPCGASLSASPL